MVNQELLFDVLAQITHRPETHRQDTWVAPCQTAFCVAGWAVELSGGWARGAYVTLLSEELKNQFHTNDVSHAAYRLLGLRYCGLFDSNNTLDDIYRTCAHELEIDEQVLRDKIAHREPPRP